MDAGKLSPEDERLFEAMQEMFSDIHRETEATLAASSMTSDESGGAVTRTLVHVGEKVITLTVSGADIAMDWTGRCQKLGRT